MATRKSSKSKVQTTSKVSKGMFAVTGKAAQRLDQSTPQTPSGPLPLTGNAPQGDSVVTPQRLWFYKLTRFNPIRQLKPETLSHYLDLFQQGYLRYFDLLADAIAQRDGTLKTVIPKRKSAVKRLRWDIVIQENLDAGDEAMAQEQHDALYSFYNRATCTEAVDLNVRKGLPHLFDRILEDVGHKYSHFEIVWVPGVDSETGEPTLTARFNWIPLWFFETRTGKSRFLLQDYGLQGEALVDGSWMVTVNEGLLEACAVLYMFKHLCLRDLLIYCDVCAAGGVVGKTDAPYGSDNFNSLANVVKQISVGFGGVMNLKDEIEKLDFSAKGNLPWMPLVDYCDRAMATLWRGADLSTISGKTSQGGQGALLQGKEEYNLQAGDAQHITEALNEQVDKLVLQWHFGKDVKVMASFKLVVPPSIEATTDIAIVNAMLSWGVKDMGAKQMHEHFGIGTMGKDDTALTQPMAAGGMGAGGKQDNPARDYQDSIEAADEMAANERKALSGKLRGIIENVKGDFAKQTSGALKPFVDAANEVLRQDDGNFFNAVRQFRKECPAILAKINKEPANASALKVAMTEAFKHGFGDLMGVKR